VHILKLYPAYGRSYPSLDEAKQAFLNGSDFSCTKMGGPYTSIRDYVGKSAKVTEFDAVSLIIPELNRVRHTVITVDDMKEFLS